MKNKFFNEEYEITYDYQKDDGFWVISEKEIYRSPDDLDENEIAETLEYFIKLKDFFVDAANKGNAVLHLIS